MGDVSLTAFSSRRQEEPVCGNKPAKSQGSVCGGGAPNGLAGSRSSLERLCQARRARRAARRLREQQRHAPKVPSNLDILERHTREVLRRLEVGPLEEVSGAAGIRNVPDVYAAEVLLPAATLATLALQHSQRIDPLCSFQLGFY